MGAKRNRLQGLQLENVCEIERKGDLRIWNSASWSQLARDCEQWKVLKTQVWLWNAGGVLELEFALGSWSPVLGSYSSEEVT